MESQILSQLNLRTVRAICHDVMCEIDASYLGGDIWTHYYLAGGFITRQLIHTAYPNTVYGSDTYDVDLFPYKPPSSSQCVYHKQTQFFDGTRSQSFASVMPNTEKIAQNLSKRFGQNIEKITLINKEVCRSLDPFVNVETFDINAAQCLYYKGELYLSDSAIGAFQNLGPSFTLEWLTENQGVDISKSTYQQHRLAKYRELFSRIPTTPSEEIH